MRAPSRTVGKARALRRLMTLPEVLLWRDLRRFGNEGMRFRRQHPIGRFVLDFDCAEARLAVEVDGAAHDDPERYRSDRARDAWLADQGVRVLRCNAPDILDDERRADVLATIAAVGAPSTALRAVPLPRSAEEDQ
jgi:very-short-patch-repair endonuclease